MFSNIDIYKNINKFFKERKKNAIFNDASGNTKFSETNLESIEFVELVVFLEKKYSCAFPDEYLDANKTINDFVNYIINTH